MNELMIRTLEEGWLVYDKNSPDLNAPWIMGREYAAESVEKVLEIVERLLRPTPNDE
jgi:hypothetical protein